MLLFRDEEHIQTWRDLWSQPPGALLTFPQLRGLADFWYSGDRRQPDWRRHTPAEGQACFDDLGLRGAFWALTPPPSPGMR
jgi:hypothetical protein